MSWINRLFGVPTKATEKGCQIKLDLVPSVVIGINDALLLDFKNRSYTLTREDGSPLHGKLEATAEHLALWELASSRVPALGA